MRIPKISFCFEHNASLDLHLELATKQLALKCSKCLTMCPDSRVTCPEQLILVLGHRTNDANSKLADARLEGLRDATVAWRLLMVAWVSAEFKIK
ncbi:unnamed protein product [Mesocestoides corti]|uniref:4Fe-4S ferredoxin-type domain-containing protein n=1 Tax=Mesocestoides corti TaxID=53468 RepID=A0A0R3UB84_MESCO|nr:unnamed protein product [Mesocestoides corti]